MKCEHKRIKKNYNHGRKSQANKHCMDCGEVVTNHDIMIIKINKKKNERKRR